MTTRLAAAPTASITLAAGECVRRVCDAAGVPVDLTDPELREEVAKSAYYRDRYDDMVADQEHDLDPAAQYFCLEWESLSSIAQRPYRVAVSVALDHVRELSGAVG